MRTRLKSLIIWLLILFTGCNHKDKTISENKSEPRSEPHHQCYVDAQGNHVCK